MSQKFITIDASKLAAKAAINIQKQSEKVGKKIVKSVSSALFEHIKEQAAQKLHTRKQFYLNNLEMKENASDGGYRIILRKPAQFIENGLSTRDLKESMLKTGQKSRVIPLSDGVLIGTNKAKKVAAASSIKFRTISINSPESSWQTKAIKGAEIFKEARNWMKGYLKTLSTKKK
jgi:hypothetical protein